MVLRYAVRFSVNKDQKRDLVKRPRAALGPTVLNLIRKDGFTEQHMP
jgi:hypothetical protein